MKKILVALIALSSIFLLSACGDNSVAKELEYYVNNELPDLAIMEEEVLYEYDSVTGYNYSDDYTLYYHLQDVIIPLYSTFIDELEAVRIESSELRKIHEIYIEASNTQYNAMVKMLSALEYQDYELISESNEMLADARAGMREFQGQLTDLLKEHKLEHLVFY